MFLKQSTASQEVMIGPFKDDTDGKTSETGLNIENTDIKIWKHGATSEVNKNSGGATHVAAGRYVIVLDATDTDTAGMLEINVDISGALAIQKRLWVGPAPCDVEQISGDATAADTLELFAEALDQATGQLDSGSLAAGTITFAAIADGAIGTGKLGSNAITSSAIQADAINAAKIADGTLTSAKFAAGAFDAVWSVATRTMTAFGFSVTVGTNNDKTGYSLSAAGITAIWSALTSSMTTVGSIGKKLADVVFNWNVGKTGYSLDETYQTTLVNAIDAALLNAGDATDLIASIVSRIGNTNIDEAALVAAIKASLFNAGSIANKLAVDGSGRVTAVDMSTLVTRIPDVIRTGDQQDTVDDAFVTNLSAISAALQAVIDEVERTPRGTDVLPRGKFKVEVTNGVPVTGGESVDMEYK
jgi:hypothetical protein